MKQLFLCFTALALVCLLVPDTVDARGGRGGGGRGGGGRGGGMSRGGGGMSRGGGRSPSMSRSAPSRGAARPSPSRPSGSLSRPSGGPSRPSGGTARPGGGQLGGAGNRPNVGSRPGTGTRPGSGQLGGSARPGAGNRPGTGGRPTQGQLNDFLDIPSKGSRPSSRPSSGQLGSAFAGGAAGGAAADFLQNRSSTRPAEGPNAGGRPDTRPGDGSLAGNRPGPRPGGERPGTRPGVGDRPGAGTRPGQRPGVGNRPGNRPPGMTVNDFGRIQNRQQWNNNRVARRNQVRDQVGQYPIRNPGFWQNHPNWARWRWNRPYRWATWAVVGSWFAWDATEPAYYSYGDNVYYEDNSVYYGEQAVATVDEYAEQAQYIASTGSTTDLADDTEWLTLGVFAITQDGEESGPPPAMYLQLAVTKEGIIAGTFYNDDTETTREIEGAVDKNSQRAAWVVKDMQWPIMETGVENLTRDEAPALLHFENGQTQQWLMVRLEEPEKLGSGQ